MKALVTRAGPGTKLVCLGNIAQIDTPYLTETTSGLTYVVNRFRGWGAFRAHHAGARRTLSAGRLRVGHPVMPKRREPLSQLGQRVAWPESPDEAVLERVPNPHPDRVYLARFTAPEFTSLCPITGQPDFRASGHRLRAAALAGREQVAEALSGLVPQSRRVSRGLHAGNRGRLVDFLKPRWLRIGGYWYPRGGMPIDVFWQTGRRRRTCGFPTRASRPTRAGLSASC
jgi:7-cyano-7-deazaguanine reductase